MASHCAGLWSLVLLASTACVTSRNAPSPQRVRGTPDQVASFAAAVLRQYAIPVSELDRSSGTVRSGRFHVHWEWQGEAVSERVDCGDDSAAVPRTETDPIELEVTVIAGEGLTIGGPAPTDGPSSIVVMRSRGRSVTSGGYCELSKSFADRIMARIAAMRGASVVVGAR